MKVATKTSKILVIGLGNSARQLAHTRHNAGRLLLTSLATRLGLSWQRSLSAAGQYIEVGEGSQTILYIPSGFINTSGFNVDRALSYFEMDRQSLPGSLLIVHDEMELKSGETKLVAAGASLKGHNGLKSIHSRLGSNCFDRLKMGIGRPQSKDPQSVGEWVMGDFTEPEWRRLRQNSESLLEDLVLPSGFRAQTL